MIAYSNCPRTQKLQRLISLERKTEGSRQLRWPWQRHEESAEFSAAQRGGTLTTLLLEGGWSPPRMIKSKSDPQTHSRTAGMSAGTQATKVAVTEKLSQRSWGL